MLALNSASVILGKTRLSIGSAGAAVAGSEAGTGETESSGLRAERDERPSRALKCQTELVTRTFG